MSDQLGWLSDRQRDGGIDRIPLPAGVPGSLWLCGKHAIARQIEVLPRGTTDQPDPNRASRLVPGTRCHVGFAPGWSTVVCLTERHELEDRYPDYVDWLDQAGGRAIWWPIADMHAPPLERMLPFVDDLVDRLRRGNSLLIHCGAGIGRAGTTAVCLLIRLGLERRMAERIVAEHRPMAGPEVGAQRDLVGALAIVMGANGDRA